MRENRKPSGRLRLFESGRREGLRLGGEGRRGYSYSRAWMRDPLVGSGRRKSDWWRKCENAGQRDSSRIGVFGMKSSSKKVSYATFLQQPRSARNSSARHQRKMHGRMGLAGCFCGNFEQFSGRGWRAGSRAVGDWQRLVFESGESVDRNASGNAWLAGSVSIGAEEQPSTAWKASSGTRGDR